MSVPIFTDGEPANLEAAALDALEWLQWLEILMNDNRFFHGRGWARNHVRLRAAIKALTAHLPDVDPVFEQTPKPPAFGAVVEVRTPLNTVSQEAS